MPYPAHLTDNQFGGNFFETKKHKLKQLVASINEVQGPAWRSFESLGAATRSATLLSTFQARVRCCQTIIPYLISKELAGKGIPKCRL